jgi:hypothetical protein
MKEKETRDRERERGKPEKGGRKIGKSGERAEEA